MKTQRFLTVLLISLLLALRLQASPPPARFNVPVTYDAVDPAPGFFPWSSLLWPVPGDFNGDGKLDVAVVGSRSNLVGLLLNQGRGVFSEAREIAVPSRWFSRIRAMDFNNDGKLDLLTGGSATNTYTVLLGRGDGTFAPPSPETAPPPGPKEYWVEVMDFNNDGNLDLLMEGPTRDTFNVLTGRGDGTFEALISKSGTLPNPPTPVLDFDSDGLADCFWSGENFALCDCDHGRVVVSLGKDGGAFSSSYFVLGGDWRTIAGDFTGDGQLDLLAISHDGSISVLAGNGDGTFNAPRLQPTDYAAHSTRVGDFNGDGSSDVLIEDIWAGSNRVLFIAGRGDGTFGVPRPLLDTPRGVHIRIGHLVVRDFNGDSRSDVALTYQSQSSTIISYTNIVSVFLGNVDGTFQHSFNHIIGVSTGSQNPPLVGPGDFNHDGQADLAVADEPSERNSPRNAATISLLLGKGDGTFEVAPSSYDGRASRGALIALGDVNGDGNLDLQQAYGSSVSLLIGKSDGTFQVAVSDTAEDVLNPFLMADFSEDGKLDLVRRSEPGAFRVFLDKGDATFQAPMSFTNPTLNRSGPDGELTTGDFNGDGTVDVIAGFDLWLGNGDGTFTFQSNLESPAANWNRLTATDFDGDGRIDLLVTAGFNRTQTVLLNRTPPVLRISRGSSEIKLSWPAFATDYVLESAADLPSGAGWRRLPEAPDLMAMSL